MIKNKKINKIKNKNDNKNRCGHPGFVKFKKKRINTFTDVANKQANKQTNKMHQSNAAERNKCISDQQSWIRSGPEPGRSRAGAG